MTDGHRMMLAPYRSAMQVVFRADATHGTGAGHVMRCWALAEEFAARGATISWHGNIDVPWLQQALGGVGWRATPCDGTAEEQASETCADLVIVDSYELETTYRASVMARGIPVVAIVDDNFIDAGPASLWVNPGAPSRLRVADDSKFLNGPDYVLIRRTVKDLRQSRRELLESGAEPRDVTILLGGTDSSNVARFLESLKRVPESIGEVFAGPGSGIDWPGSAIRWIPAGPDLMDRAAHSAYVVSASGVTSWELAHIGVPMGLVQVVGNQAGNYAWMTGNGWADPLGRLNASSDPQALARALLDALTTPRGRGRPQIPGIDGCGASRIVDAVMCLL